MVRPPRAAMRVFRSRSRTELPRRPGCGRSSGSPPLRRKLKPGLSRGVSRGVTGMFTTFLLPRCPGDSESANLRSSRARRMTGACGSPGSGPVQTAPSDRSGVQPPARARIPKTLPRSLQDAIAAQAGSSRRFPGRTGGRSGRPPRTPDAATVPVVRDCIEFQGDGARPRGPGALEGGRSRSRACDDDEIGGDFRSREPETSHRPQAGKSVRRLPPGHSSAAPGSPPDEQVRQCRR